jgi:preprotein translocase subunit SecF
VGSLLFAGSLLLGAETLKDLSLALFIGIAAGAYSSIFVAAQVLSIWKEREPRFATVKERLLARELSAKDVHELEEEDEEFEDLEEEEEEELPTPTPSVPSLQPRSGQAVRVQQRRLTRRQRKRKKRR